MKKTIVIGLMGLAVFLGICEVVRGAVNCANNNVSYTLEIGGGKDSVLDGETPAAFTADIEPSDTSVTAPVWSLDPPGGGEGGLTTPVITPSEDGMSATIEFFWHAEEWWSRTCTYTLECTTESDCVATKTIVVSLPSGAWGDTSSFRSVNLEVVWVGSGFAIEMVRVDIYQNGDSTYNPDLLETSQFRNKIESHEGQHVSDLTGSPTPASARGVEYALFFLEDNNLDTCTYIDMDLVNEVEELVEEVTIAEVVGELGNITSWMEKRAYGVSNEEIPDYFEPAILSD